MGSLKALGSYSDTNKGSDLWGYSVSGSFAPSIRLNDDQFLIPLYSGEYKRMRQYVTEEEGGRLYNTWQIHNVSTALRTRHSQEWTSRIMGIATWSLVKETRDESFGKGLYDYRDFGAAFDIRRTIEIDESEKQAYSCGVQYFRRVYPNFKSLISLAAVTAPEKDEKDFDGFKLSCGAERSAPNGISWEFKPSFLVKLFTDKKLLGDDGILKTGEKRKDYIVSGDLNLDWALFEGRLVLSADNNASYNQSDLDFYDSRGSLSLSDDIFTENYYNYLNLLTYPYLTYYHRLDKERNFALRAGYSFLLRAYPGRKAQESSGVYTTDDQQDKEHSLHLSASYPITKELSWVSYFDYSWMKSNQKYENYYWYTYEVYQAQTGISIEF